MYVDPFLQLRLLLAAFFAGVGMGALSECGRVLRLLLGGHTPPAFMRTRYERPLPLVGVAVGFPKRRVTRLGRCVIAFF